MKQNFKSNTNQLFFSESDLIDPFYFVHSYYVKPKNRSNILATYSFGGREIPAIVTKNNILGCQFHPEKSSKQGLNIISKFLKN